MDEYIVVLCTVKDKIEAEKIAKNIIKNKMAACVNIIEGLTSIYEWEGEICTNAECLIIIKTKAIIFNDLKESILSQHSYDVPEIISLPINDGLELYLSWIKQNTK